MVESGMATAKLLEPLQAGIQISCAMIVLTYFISGIWNSVWISFINNDLYLLLDGGRKLRDEVLSVTCLAWGTILMALIFLICIYLFGYAFVLHAIIGLVAFTAAVSEIVLLGLTAKLVDGGRRTTIRRSFEALITLPSQKPVQDWMRDNKCATAAACSTAIDKYLFKRNLLGFGFNIALCIFFGLGIIGVIIVMSLMASIKPVARDVSEAQPVSNHTLTDDPGEASPPAEEPEELKP